jgi:hypothetical protein
LIVFDETPVASRGRIRALRSFCFETLESRVVPAPIPFIITISDPGHEFAPFPALTAAIPAAEQILSNLFDGKGSIDVEVTPDDQANRGGGGIPTVVPVGTSGGLTVVEAGAEKKALTGVDPNGSAPDIVVTYNPISYLPIVATGTQGVTNMTFNLVHEVFHGLGISGYRSISGPAYGQITASTESVFDSLSAFGAGGDSSVLYFIGPQAEAIYGGPVPLTSLGPSDTTGESFYHVGNPSGRPGDMLLNDLMNGIAFSDTPPSSLDLAILSDLGWKTLSQSSPPPSRTPPQATGVVDVGHSKKGLISVTIGFNEALDGSSAGKRAQYSLLGAVKTHGKEAFSKSLHIRRVRFEGNSQVTIYLARPYKGAVLVTVRAGLVAANGLSSLANFSTVVE